MLKLKKPIVFFDLETTGLDRETARIVQIGMSKLMPDFTVTDHFACLVNPGIPIPGATTAIHGIRDEDVKDAETFAELAPFIYQYLVGCDLGGFNSNWYDIPVLAKEFDRAGLILDARAFNMVDVGNLFKIREPRNLANAMRFYCNAEIEKEHDAMSDNTATIAVFLAQLNGYDDLPETVEELAIYTNYGCKMADLSGKFVYDKDGVLLLNFGQKKGQPAKQCMDYIHWMYFKGTFADDTRAICADLLGYDSYYVQDVTDPLKVNDVTGDDLPF